MTITRINEFQAAQGKSEGLHEFLKSLLPYILSSEGCISCVILQKLNESGAFVLIEKWYSVEAHKKSVDDFPKELMHDSMQLFAVPPKGAYYH